jgi:DNA-binding FadR family transcriptional regulator
MILWHTNLVNHFAPQSLGLRAHRSLLECIAAGDAKAARGAVEPHLCEAELQWRGEQVG